MNEFDIVNSPLEGVNLIEASAGTGKTHTISFLVLRLILEKRLSIDRILVVTFTQAATQELKERVLSLLLKARDAILSGKSNDPVIDQLIKQRKRNRHDIETIQNAIIDFDKASIFTIHGFCSRILYDNAFETANRFDEELVQDPFFYSQEVTDDFWRQYIYLCPIEFVSYINLKWKGPENFLSLLNKVNALEIDIIPFIKHAKTPSLNGYRNTLNGITDVWKSSRNDILALLKDEALNGKIYGGLKSDSTKADQSARLLKIKSIASDMDLFLDNRSTGFPLFKDFELFTATKITQSSKKGTVPPRHSFFDTCDELLHTAEVLEEEFKTYLLYLKGQLFQNAKAELDKIKDINNIRFFNDLILKVRNAIHHSDGSDNVLTHEIRNKYTVALVDEFQDTDSIQYDIFSTLFSSKNNILFMIGDPKQAIYSFRGADVFSYMEAARRTDSSYTLTENWRSSKNHITAVNTFFSNIKNPFIFNDISFDPGKSAKCDSEQTQIDIPPLKIWFVRSNSGKPLNKADTEKIASTAVVNEITSLISSKKNRCKEKFKEGDIAVLVRTNRQALVIKKYLSQKNINSVLFSTGDIFLSHEAGEIERLLIAINDPGNVRHIKSAFCTDMMGMHAELFDSHTEESDWLDDIFKRFKVYKRIWETKGIIHMYNHFLINETVKKRLLAYPDGERRVTNILHLGQLLQEETVRNKKNMTGLIKWLSEQRDPNMPRKEENQLHLESDKRAVNIVTIHKSKGLEYPVVFCPFAYEGVIKQDDDVLFHEIENKRKLTFDLRGKESEYHLTLAQKEQLAEHMRLFYVAITRAKKACYLMWGDIKSAHTSPISYLLYADDLDDDNDIVKSLKNYFLTKTSNHLVSDIKQFSSRSDGTIEILEVKDPKETLKVIRQENKEKNLCSKKFLGNIDASWKIISYSALVSTKEKETDAPDHDVLIHTHSDMDLIASRETHLKDNDISSFPKGAKTGIFFHDLFEHLDFTLNDLKTYGALVSEKLQMYGFDTKWKNSVCQVIDNVLNMPLEINGSSLILAKIKNNDRINEMEFYYPINTVTSKRIISLFSNDHNPSLLKKFPYELEKLKFSPVKGFIKGYIDLVFFTENKFYLVDWKSNFLGTEIENYNFDRLISVMNHSYYTLQYNLYTLALHQYLTNSFPGYTYEKNFGGVFYIFLRGVDRQMGPTHGIFKDQPSIELLNNMGNMLIPEFKEV